ncbi:autotransporter domain-containing protein [Sphingomonas oleivorans]|uniref:Autotransporter domain-containing protein n=1 Tax=Sphingomonas oleivorans TaxID=1735121 RepID=A0A2T5FUL0_9SPHN|nr:autotransporter outer membrane beta-barrel domain-containing protein [Sphingomonas oleivorans]PTQ08211.1 autotransporter domain-containing protein [Sphingomonas oleivorans]
MRCLLASTCLTPLAILAIAAPLRAETVIDSRRTTPIATSTANAGTRDNIRITAAGIIAVPNGIAVTLDSANSVGNEGTIQISDANDATGILGAAGVAGTIGNSGKIILDENYTPADTDKDGDLDGPLANGARRFGIRTAGAFTGNITNSGTITIEGNDSAGIALGGPLAGSLNSSGGISVTGNNSYGVRAGDVTGDVRLSGLISAQGANAVGAALDGNIGGTLIVQGGIGATGYRSTTAPSDQSKLDADDLLQGGPALRIAGDVARGIIFDVPPKDSDPNKADEDNDGIEDAKEGSASVTSSGAAPAVQIGAAGRDVTVGALAGNAAGHGLVVNGTISGNGVYNNVNGNALTIGGLGGAVTIAGGMMVNGTVGASSAGASATAIRIGDRATVNEIRVGGIVSATGGSAATARSSAILIEAGATVGTIRNSGQIKASSAGGNGSAAAIVDRSGKLGLVENSGLISAAGAPAGSDRAVAIDLRANNGGATLRQTKVADGVAAPLILGDVLFGGGNDIFDVADGGVNGTTRFGAGANRLTLSGDAAYTGEVVFGAGSDMMALSGTSSFSGKADFGGGADSLTLADGARFSGTLAGSTGLAVNVANGTLDLSGSGPVALSTLNLGAKGVMSVSIDAATGASTLYQVSGAASFAEGSKVTVRLSDIRRSEGRYVIVRAGALSGGSNLASAETVLPFLYKSSLAANPAANEISLEIKRKTTSELGLNGSQSRAFDAVYAALGQDAKVGAAFLDIIEGDRFRRTLRQMLPDHAGGTFEAVTQGSRATARLLADPNGPFSDQGRWGYWLQQVAWGTSKNLGDTAAYDIAGWGASGGAEIKTDGLGNFGLSLAYLAGQDKDGGTANEVASDQYEVGAYWRGRWGGLSAHARASAAHIEFNSRRSFTGQAGSEKVSRVADGAWNGRLLSAAGGLSYEMRYGRISLRPVAAVDYYRLKEDGYRETGGGKAFDLIVSSRTSDELALSGTMAAGLNFGDAKMESGWFRAELEGGRRQIVGGSLGRTTARFEDGQAFTLLPEDRTDGWVGKLRLIGGNAGFAIGGEFNAEEQQGRAAVAFRVSLQMGL